MKMKFLSKLNIRNLMLWFLLIKDCKGNINRLRGVIHGVQTGTEPGFISCKSVSFTNLGAFDPGISTAPITRSASDISAFMLYGVE